MNEDPMQIMRDIVQNDKEFDIALERLNTEKEVKKTVRRLFEIHYLMSNTYSLNVVKLKELENETIELIKKLPDKYLANYVLFGVTRFHPGRLPDIVMY